MRREGFVAIPGNHGLGYVSVPPISPYENALPLNDEGSIHDDDDADLTGGHPEVVAAVDCLLHLRRYHPSSCVCNFRAENRLALRDNA